MVRIRVRITVRVRVRVMVVAICQNDVDPVRGPRQPLHRLYEKEELHEIVKRRNNRKSIEIQKQRSDKIDD